MKIAFFFLGLLALATATDFLTPTKKVADKDFLEKQNLVLKLLWGLGREPQCPHMRKVAQTYNVGENVDLYTNVEAVKHFVTLYKFGTLPKDEVFTVFNKKQLQEAVALFDVLYFAKDFDTFQKTAVWARFNFNVGQFVYAFTAAVAHREDFNGVVLPAPYEVYPQLFVNSDVLQKAFRLKFERVEENNQEPVVLTVNSTDFYPYYQYNTEKVSYHPFVANYYDRPERRLAYFTEDVALNTYNFYHHVYNPFFLNSTYGYNLDGRGELFFYYHQQLLSRYFLERLSNDLSNVEPVSFDKPLPYGYDPKLRYPNGQSFPVRPDNLEVNRHTSFEYQLLDDFARRVVDAVDFGSVFSPKKEAVSLYDTHGLDYLGHLVEGTTKSVHPQYYGKLFYYGMKAFGHVSDPHYTHNTAPGVLEHYETALRDPLYYRLVSFLTQLYHRYKYHLDKYSYDELVFPGVKVTSVEVDKLVTFFENFEFDVTTVVSTKHPSEDLPVKVRQYRLNHKPFTYKVHVTSDKATNAMVRVFLGPKYDSEGRYLTLEERRRYMVEVDRFPHKVTEGENVFVRNSQELFGTTTDPLSVPELYETVNSALKGEKEFTYEEVDRQCGFPNRFLLPKGKRGGLPLTLFVTVTPLPDDVSAYDTKYHSTVGCGHGLGLFFQDNHAMGYPFDRPVDETQFFVPNFFEKDVIVFHKRADEAANFV